MTPAMREALDAKRRRDLADLETFRYLREVTAEADWNRSGHWHAPHLPCSDACPASNPKTRNAFRRILATV